jgi:hypothetical protein
LKSGSLNLLQPPGLVRACNGIALNIHTTATVFLDPTSLQIHPVPTFADSSPLVFHSSHPMMDVIYSSETSAHINRVYSVKSQKTVAFVMYTIEYIIWKT